MFTPGEYRKKALAFGGRAKSAPAPKQESEFRVLEDTFMHLADNEEWLARQSPQEYSRP